MIKKILPYGIYFVAIPLAIVLGVKLFADRQYAFVSLAVALLACVPFFMAFEKKKESNTKRMIVLAVMVALSVLGRFLFVMIPFFKPITAIVILTALYFGPEMGFLCGALSALISNASFGQGPWTPFQMLVWGGIGLLAGLLAMKLKSSRIALSLFGVFAGIVFSLIMDIWAVLWIDGVFNLSRYGAALVTALPVTLIYAVSNVVFLLLIIKPVGKKLERIKLKYGL